MFGAPVVASCLSASTAVSLQINGASHQLCTLPKGSPLSGQLIQAPDIAEHGDHQHHREPAGHEHGQPQVAHQVHHITARQLLGSQVDGVHVLELHQSVHSIHICKQLLTQVLDVIHLVLELVAQRVAACDALYRKTKAACEAA